MTKLSRDGQKAVFQLVIKIHWGFGNISKVMVNKSTYDILAMDNGGH